MNGSLDTNVILRWLLDDVPGQHASARALVDAGQFRVSDAAVIETCFALNRYYKFTRAEVNQVVIGFLCQPTIVSNLQLVIDTLDLYVARPKLGFEDCYLVTAAAHDHSAPLFTFDRKLATQSNAELVT